MPTQPVNSLDKPKPNTLLRWYLSVLVLLGAIVLSPFIFGPQVSYIFNGILHFYQVARKAPPFRAVMDSAAVM